MPESDDLKKRVKELEDEIAELWRESHELAQREKEVARREAKMDQIEDDFFRERDQLRARARRRDRDQLEKAMHGTRLEAVRALRSMLRSAKSQAKKGKPALLRLILRSTR